MGRAQPLRPMAPLRDAPGDAHRPPSCWQNTSARFPPSWPSFPAKMRFTMLLIGYSLAVTIFGGLAPFVATYLIRETGSSVLPASS